MDRIPYGTKYSYDNLTFIFPKATIRTSRMFPDLSRYENTDDTTRVLIIVSPEFAPEPDEMHALIHFAASGKNQIFISALSYGDTVMRMLNLSSARDLFGKEDSAGISLLDPIKRDWEKYSYPGYSNRTFFTGIDTGYTMILGRDIMGRPDFVRISYVNGGSIFIHLDPFAFSNFFLLHKENKSYYDIALSYMSRHAGVVEWSDYFRYRKRRENFSSLRFILGNRSLRWAFWLSLILFLLIFIVESKRKQRAIKVIPDLRNASEDFVKTVGRLYFEQKNNQNLTTKMVAAFLENIRSAYKLSTSFLDEDFVQKLSFRSGRPVSEATKMVQLIHEVRLKPVLSDQELMDLHNQISQFNKPV